ncbi:MAG: DNA polymerase III subunit delta [Thermosynechococcaceae cyanobacterium MS004]|nr:DNA polymerase III subunit delta [Thermosynechococcaceae cyanobacterium MS004]
MPAYLFWGDDQFRLQQAVQALICRVVEPAWKSFNYDQVEGGASGAIEGLIEGLNQAMTPAFGGGDRLVWLVNPPLGGQESSLFREELERTLPALPQGSHLLLTYEGKPDGRSKITKFLQQSAQVEEFALVPPWKTDAIRRAIQQTAQQRKVSLTREALDLLVDAVGNDTRQLISELEKLKLYVGVDSAGAILAPVEAAQVTALVSTTQQSALELANMARQGLTDKALGLVEELLNHNEPPLRLSATLIKQFRTWLWIKLLQDEGERDERAIAKAAEIANPKRIYFLSQDVRSISRRQLQQALEVLLTLEASLKQGQDPKGTLQTKVIELCQICRGGI